MTQVLEDPEVKDWRALRQKKHLVISASQIETWRLCHRKWWLTKVRKLPEPQKSSLTFGTVIHGVIERYQNADDLGRGPDGNPVELYPPGWEQALDRYTKKVDGVVDAREQILIKQLIEKAVAEGVLQRLPGRLVESDFRRTVVDEGVHIQIVGFIDVVTANEVQDHKSAKNTKYTKTAKTLKLAPQMLIYAYEVIQRAIEKGLAPPPTIRLRHNIFVKSFDDPQVKKVEAVVTAAEAMAEWDRIIADGRGMRDLREHIEIWHEITEPVNTNAACNAFGGCAFKTICFGFESPEGYERRILQNTAKNEGKLLDGVETPGKVIPIAFGHMYKPRLGDLGMFNGRIAQPPVGQQVNNALPNGTTATVMPINPPVPAMPPPSSPVQQQLFAQAMPLPPLVSPLLTVPAPAEPVTRKRKAAAAPAPAAAPAQTVATELPPWAHADCTACRGMGFMTKGGPCKICDAKCISAKRETSAAFHIEPMGDGLVTVVHRVDPNINGICSTKSFPEAAPVTPTVTAAPAVVVQAPAQQVNPAVTAAIQAPVGTFLPHQPAAAEVAEQVEAVMTAASAALEDGKEAKKGRPKKGFILVLNAVVAKGEGKLGTGRGVIRLEELLAKLGAQMAAQHGAPTYYALDTWKRRDGLASEGEAIAASLGTDIVVCSGIGQTGSSDLRALFDAIRPYADLEIVAEK